MKARRGGKGKVRDKLQRFFRSKEKFSRKLRLFFRCAHDLSLAECGRGGQGYEVTELLEWVKKMEPLAKMGLVLGSIVLKTFTGLSVPTAHFEAAFADTLGEAVSGMFAEAGIAVVEGEDEQGGGESEP